MRQHCITLIEFIHMKGFIMQKKVNHKQFYESISEIYGSSCLITIMCD